MRAFLILFLLLSNICSASINFIHIHKTGGSTLKNLLRKRFDSSQKYKHHIAGTRPYEANKTKAKNILKNNPMINHELAIGHLPMWFFLAKDPHYETSFFFTVLREPIERTLSQIRFRKRNGMPRTHPHETPLNNMCKMLCSDVTLEGEDLLEDAINTLHRMNFIIFMDDYNNGVRALFKELDLELDHEIPHHNATKKEPVSDKVIKILEKRNVLDLRLYEYAKAHYNPATHTLN